MAFTDFTEVVPGLYIGSHPQPEDPFELGATVVVTLTPETSARSVPRNGVLIHWPIKDGPIPQPEILESVATFIVTTLRIGFVVYVHCEAGMNRSALVVARVLMESGMSAREAIDLVRDGRKGSLSEEYADWLLSDPGRAATAVVEPSMRSSTHELWSAEFSGKHRDFPRFAVSDGIVYIGQVWGDWVYPWSRVLALEVATGRSLWVFSELNLPVHVLMPVGDVVYVASDKRLLALTASEGELIWSVDMGARIVSPLAVAEGIVYAALQGGTCHALSAVTGQEIWQFQSRYSLACPPTVDSGVVCVGSGDSMQALTAADGEPIWSSQIVDIALSAPTMVQGVVYVVGTRGIVHALDAANGQQIWETRFVSTATPGSWFCSPVVVGGVICVGVAMFDFLYAMNANRGKSRVHGVYTLAASNGKQIWSNPDAHLVSSPRTTGGEVLWVELAERLIPTSASSGQRAWELDIANPLAPHAEQSWPLAIVDEVVFLVSCYGYWNWWLHVLSAPTPSRFDISLGSSVAQGSADVELAPEGGFVEELDEPPV